MISKEIIRMYQYLCSFLGDSKGELDESYQLQFPCPRCADRKGEGEREKYNLEVNLRKGVFQCWSCCQVDNEMHGSIFKLIELYGNKDIEKAYKTALNELRESSMYKMTFGDDDFNYGQGKKSSDVELPTNYIPITSGNPNCYKAMEYLFSRGIDMNIINEYQIGLTEYRRDQWQVSNRIIIPSLNRYGELNYWTGRDFTGKAKQKYYNPKVERKDIIFNEDKIQWDADVTLVEGPFDHIVVPNSIPLLGKSLGHDYRIYQEVANRCNARVNIFLDGDAEDSATSVYRLLDNGRLAGKVRMITPREAKDPSEIFQEYGRYGIMYYLARGRKL